MPQPWVTMSDEVQRTVRKPCSSACFDLKMTIILLSSFLGNVRSFEHAVSQQAMPLLKSGGLGFVPQLGHLSRGFRTIEQQQRRTSQFTPVCGKVHDSARRRPVLCRRGDDEEPTWIDKLFTPLVE